MKKDKNDPKPYSIKQQPPSTVEEPYLSMPRVKRLQAAVADFSFKKFKKIADKVPFTQSEWASILHLSERTLQRYAKDNKNFEGIYVDRILQVEQLILLGLDVFTDADALYAWLKKPKNILGTPVDFDALYHSDGINEIYNQLQRIQQGIYA